MISEDPIKGVKCAHATKSVGTYPFLTAVCESLNIEGIGYGSLISFQTQDENDRAALHFMEVTTGQYPYAFIGLRKMKLSGPE